MSQTITLADLTVANDGPVDRVEYARRSAIAAKSVQAFTVQTAAPALESLLVLASAPGEVDPDGAKRLAEEVTAQTEAVMAEVERFTEMARKT